jgi:predicted membrane-bound spermidine synthase
LGIGCSYFVGWFPKNIRMRHWPDIFLNELPMTMKTDNDGVTTVLLWNRSKSTVLPLFFLSGISALIYQVVWQRALFAMTGTDLESTTIIVTLFMFGLGAGAVAGGQIADRLPRWRIAAFALGELVVGVYGLLSLHLIALAAGIDVGAGAAATFLKAAATLLLPTVLMGATLPILIAYFYEKNRNIGVSTGMLYTSNTLGAAVGAGSTGFFLFGQLGLSGSVETAAIINFIVAISALLLFAREKAA